MFFEENKRKHFFEKQWFLFKKHDFNAQKVPKTQTPSMNRISGIQQGFRNHEKSGKFSSLFHVFSKISQFIKTVVFLRKRDQ